MPIVAIPLILCLLPLVAGPLAAQQRFVDETAARLPVRHDASMDLSLGDFDQDGDLDILVANTGLPGDRCRLMVNDGAGYFTDRSDLLPGGFDRAGAVAAGDLDGDGDLDLVIVNTNKQDRLFLNRGDGSFADETAGRLPPDSGADTDGALVDLDGDGDLDLLVVGLDTLRLLLNDGAGHFEDHTAGRLPARAGEARAVALADLDLDGDLDAVLVNQRRDRDQVWVNDGTGTFTDLAPPRIPADTLPGYAVAIGDVDEDGDLDLAIGDFTDGSPGDRLVMNLGGLLFADETAERLPPLPFYSDETADLDLADVDGDGDRDLVSIKYEQSFLLVNRGDGTFVDATAERLPVDATTFSQEGALGDLDADGDLDLVIANLTQENDLYINEGPPDTTPPRFLWATVLPDTADTLGPYLVRADVADNALWMDLVEVLHRPAGGGEFSGAGLRDMGGGLYRGEIPGPGTSATVEYYYRAIDRQGNAASLPAAAPESLYTFRAGSPVGLTGPGSGGREGARGPVAGWPFPNPSTGWVVIPLEGGAPGLAGGPPLRVSAEVLDLRGRRVRTLDARGGLWGALVWDGRDDRGIPVAEGIYLLRVSAPGGRVTRRLVRAASR